ncbi:MAG: adenine-specific methyltransferase EcoRI family protein [Prevotella sp.]|nr:adenine-specific methyltransferase EcoRI family protein [Prevotella sp.]
MAIRNLDRAKEAKKDEFYTQLADIENELKHYRQHFRGKTILCNCDDPYESNFFKYFANNFNAFGLKKLIATCYNGSPVQGSELMLDFGDFQSDEPKKIAYKVEITEVSDVNGDGRIDLADVRHLIQNDKNVLSVLKENGDFRSKECIELLKEADIVVTNPPFSLFREYVAQLMKFEKKFIIIGPYNAITYKELFPLIKENQMWLGYGFKAGNAYFRIPDGRGTEYVEGVFNAETNLVKFRNCTWFTNLEIPKRHEELILFHQYSSEEYPKYDNYDAINVNATNDIPVDYDGAMGVPITFLDKYNPEQFEIIRFRKGNDEKDLSINGKCPYFRILIRKKK